MMGDGNNGVEISSESYDDSEIEYSERKPRSRERGPDKKPRTYRANSMRNLEQFSNRPQEFQTYLKDEKGIDITGNTSTAKIVLAVIGIVLAGLGNPTVFLGV